MDVLEIEMMGLRMYNIRTCYSPEFEKQKPEFLKVLPEKMKLFSQFLGKKSWFAGSKLTYVDFVAYDLLDVLHIFEPRCLDAFPNPKDFLGCFEGLNKISAYMETSRFACKHRTWEGGAPGACRAAECSAFFLLLFTSPAHPPNMPIGPLSGSQSPSTRLLSCSPAFLSHVPTLPHEPSCCNANQTDLPLTSCFVSRGLPGPLACGTQL